MSIEGNICYNKGCGKAFDSNNNHEDSCTYHCGKPVFHDAYKYWSCCSKKCINFTDFLNIPGCCKGKHLNEKPVEEKPKEFKAIYVKSTKELPIDRPSINEPLTKIRTIMDKAFNNQNKFNNLINQDNKKSTEPSMDEICSHHACGVIYCKALKDDTVCCYHPGQPVFHEGMKYWSCCQKKTSDFTTFLNQMGCVKGEHLWNKKNEADLSPECKYDWHQTASYIYITIYSKNSDFNHTVIDANRVFLKIHIEYRPKEDSGLQTFDKNIALKEIIDISQSTVTFFMTKVEIKLKKMVSTSWKTLEMDVS
ncbi:unnamed protein product [Gordionus sp. m RMFG-2023]|uniref:cysteine and histidine-rich domain-containing protein 1-like isoform X2 n=1 Tax=Gordionus sp. m RMFG-2023 TaxID=3053472 RepID=UPI0030DDE7D0